jgi:hypothetical protein
MNPTMECLKRAGACGLLLLGWGVYIAPGFAFDVATLSRPIGLDWMGRPEWKTPLPGRINLNTADFNELMSLPVMSESLALQLLELRPLRSFKDLYRLESLTPSQTARLIEVLQTQVLLEIAPTQKLRQ